VQFGVPFGDLSGGLDTCQAATGHHYGAIGQLRQVPGQQPGVAGAVQWVGVLVDPGTTSVSAMLPSAYTSVS
jgi:hypothetical protein